MRKIRRAVQGIDVPAEGRFALGPSALLGHNRVFRKMRAQAGDDGLFGAPVGLRHDVDLSLVADVDRAVEFREQNRSRFPRRLHSHIEK